MLISMEVGVAAILPAIIAYIQIMQALDWM
jgi:hypothetical protein